LNSFFQNWLRFPHKGLIILTSRFHFPQLARYSGVGFHQLDLVRLSKEDGVSLLEKLNVYGEQNLLEMYVEKLHGHPLALRVLASTVKRCCYGDLTKFKDEGIQFGGDEDRLSQKLEHLLSFYEKQLRGGQRELLGIISLFKRPVETGSFVTLLHKMKSLKNTPLANADIDTVEQQLNLLIDDFLIEKTEEGITTHPVIRDYFRSKYKITGARREVADFLRARPGDGRPKNIEEVRDLVEAVELLCDEGEFNAADDLFNSRLVEGGFGYDVFRDIPALAEGIECCQSFINTKTDELINQLNKSNPSKYYRALGIYNMFLGNMTQSLEWYNKELEISVSEIILLSEISIVECALGHITKAKSIINQSINLEHNEGYKGWMNDFAYQAYYEFLLGDVKRAFINFEIALLYEQKRSPSEKFLYALPGIRLAEFFLRLKLWDQFIQINDWNISTCNKNQWRLFPGICHILQGWYEICRGQLSQAEKALTQAEHILRPSFMLENICRLDWAWALLAEAKEDYQKGLHHVNDALLTCADKTFRLRQAEHFILRGRLYLLQFHKENQENLDLVEKAGDDGNEALKIAEHTGYIWAKVDALALLHSYHQARTKLSNFNTEEEKESAQRYAKEATALKKGLFLTEKQMEEIKTQARKEFEKQTAGWDEK
jgi:tetratricopeptide (TPR) repeat protein